MFPVRQVTNPGASLDTGATVPATRTTPAADAARFVELFSTGKAKEATQFYAAITGTNPDLPPPPIAYSDTTSYEAQLTTQIGAQMHIRNFATQVMPNLFKGIKIQG